jgi:hypothetical protein
LPNVDTQLTHPDDIVEELESWVKTYAYIQNLSDIAQAHYHFEMIHPFSDGNGHLPLQKLNFCSFFQTSNLPAICFKSYFPVNFINSDNCIID